uniref:Core shell protein Gag P30 domain-containing protein n=1 Tax=Gopherus agassizii TaxID=38772 RepID=A0A452GMC5_9SAUR
MAIIWEAQVKKVLYLPSADFLNPSPVVMAEPMSPLATALPPYREMVPSAPEIAPPVGVYPLLTEDRISRQAAQDCVAETVQLYNHVPFDPMVLAAFKAQAGEFSTNPSLFISVFEGCLVSHKPDWDDCQVLLRTLLSEVEWNQVLAKAREEAERRHEADPEHVPEPKHPVPFRNPQWDPNNQQHFARLAAYKDLLLHGLRHSVVRHNNWANRPYYCPHQHRWVVHVFVYRGPNQRVHGFLSPSSCAI